MTVVGPDGIIGSLTIAGIIPFVDPAGHGLNITGQLGGRMVALHAPVG